MSNYKCVASSNRKTSTENDKDNAGSARGNSRKAFKEITDQIQNLNNKYVQPNDDPIKPVSNASKFKEIATQTNFPWSPGCSTEQLKKNKKSKEKKNVSDFSQNDIPPSPTIKTRKPITIFNHPNINYRDNDTNIFQCTEVEAYVEKCLKLYEPFLEKNSILDVEVRRPAEKTNLLKKLQRRRSSLFKEEIKDNSQDNNSTEYLQDIIQHEFKIETKFILRKSHLRVINWTFRIAIVDWLMKLLDQFDINLYVFLMGIRIFDFTIVKLEIADSSFATYKLTAICSLWICIKYDNSLSTITIHKLFSICGGLFTRQEILSAECKILKVVNFELIMGDPLVFITFFITEDHLYNDKSLKKATEFIMEYATLFPEWPHVLPSLLAEAGFLLAKLLLGYEEVPFFFHSEYNDRKFLQKYTNLLLHQLKWLSAVECPYKEVISRYNTEDSCYISQILIEKSDMFDYL